MRAVVLVDVDQITAGLFGALAALNVVLTFAWQPSRRPVKAEARRARWGSKGGPR